MIDNTNNESGFVNADQNDNGSGFVTENEDNAGSGFVTENEDNAGSGFVTENEDNAGSGFVTENMSSSSQQSSQSSYAGMNLNTSGFGTQEATFSEIKQLTTSGAMSDIYTGLQNGRRKVMIKRIKSIYRNDAQYRDLFFKEYDNCLDLNHPNIVRAYGKGEDEEGPYFFMEYIDGRTLTEIMKNGERNVKLFKKIILELCDALSYLHKKQIYHRDLKPDNIMITYKGDNVKIIDLGLAGSDNIVDNLKRAGTPKYSAPELLTAASTADQRSDIYSLGKIAIEYFTDSTELWSIDQIEDEKIKEFARKATQESVNERFQNCEEIIEFFSEGNQQPQHQPIPQNLEEKIKEFCCDGSITDTELEYIKHEQQKLNLDQTEIDFLIKIEIDKAKKKKEQKQAAAVPVPAAQNEQSGVIPANLRAYIKTAAQNGYVAQHDLQYLQGEINRLNLNIKDVQALIDAECMEARRNNKPKQQVTYQNTTTNNYKGNKSKGTAAVLAFFLGGIGIHKFYLGKSGWGILYLLFCWTYVPAVIALIEFFVLLCMSENEFNRKYNS